MERSDHGDVVAMPTNPAFVRNPVFEMFVLETETTVSWVPVAKVHPKLVDDPVVRRRFVPVAFVNLMFVLVTVVNCASVIVELTARNSDEAPRSTIEGSESVIVPSPSSVTVSSVAVPAIQAVRSATEMTSFPAPP